MARSTNRFVTVIYFWWLIAPILSAMLFPAFMPAEGLQIQAPEVDFAIQCDRDLAQINESARANFDAWFVQTGILRQTLTSSVHAEDTGWSGYSWMGGMTHKWFAKFWMFTYRVIWRWTAFWPLYIAGIFGIVAPCLGDGLVVRARKRYEFGSYNPLAFNIWGTLLSLGIGLMIYLPMWPWSLTAIVMASLFCGLGGFAWFATANFRTS
ncbi:DUF4400 domain-containing protein [Burkholderia sp. Ac-20365]|uniref:DUF4400 domain-containing protein n=1 Tax=Burkholderia sp. Ac-20365 TaxID=2703897 RepID=UPI00197C91F0|nr:DUF4400 domain-containing protein [Burkholderia sp. Ac-20365]MBN3761053.1 DUF4400 domain-containing protein [Burkholderia sp. Ac-20365]